MIPILYEKTEKNFTSNGLGRLYDVISFKVTEERNGIYEADFEMPITGAHYNEIQLGRIVAVTHDDTGDVQPFDIVSYSKPINGVVTFHAVHISYRQSFYTVTASNVLYIPSAYSIFKNQSKPAGNPFNYVFDYPNGATNTIIAAFDGLPHTIKSILGGTEGSILDSVIGGGEYEWDKFNVILHEKRGQHRDLTIRYGVNMTDYKEDSDASGCYSAVVPYWTDGTTKIIGDRQTNGSTITGRGETIPLDVSDKFESQPTKAQVNAMGLSILKSSGAALPTQTIDVEFLRLQDLDEYAGFAALMQCELCDTVNVVFPEYNVTGAFKIVKVVWDVLRERFESMQLGTLSTTLSEALGISSGGGSLNGSGSGIVLLTESYTNIAVPSALYVKIDSLSNIIDTTKYDLLSMTVKGWSGVAPLNVALGSNGNDVYIMGRSQGTTVSMSVIYAFILK